MGESRPCAQRCNYHHDAKRVIGAKSEELFAMMWNQGHWHGEKKYYGGSKPLCPKCNYHHDGPCAPKCHRCNIVGHLVRNCRRPTNDNTTNNQRGTGTSQKVNCYECGNQGHYRSDCPEQKNRNHENQTRGAGARGAVHALREGETDQDPNNIKDEIKA
ncbi:putative reverse transcriptase domain-containing protein [Tanacetum coccineum]